MIIKIENENLVVEINQLGAELFSIKSKKTDTEYLWQGNSEYWAGRAPVLFPVCGRMTDGKYFYKNKEYPMPIHGFAKLFEFECDKKSNSKVELILNSNEQTKEYYPFDFKFIMTYELIENTLKITHQIINNDNEDMYFSFGAHPGFNVPFVDSEKFEDYYIEFSKDCLDEIVFSQKCYYTGEMRKLSIPNKVLNLNHDLFNIDARFFATDTDSVYLKSTKNDRSIKVSYQDMTCLGLWHKPRTDAPYVCIEPWHGVPADDGKIDNLQTKRQMIVLSKQDCYTNSYQIQIND